MNTPQLTRFTPSLMPADLLERLFVERGPLLDRIMARVAEAASSSGRNHTLLVGPRGAGKTHLIALAYYRTKALMAGEAALQVAWLPEDPWTITTYSRLLRAILDRLEPPAEVREMPRDAADLEALIVGLASQGPIVVLVENLDQVLAAIGEMGQQRLRHLLQDRRPLLLIASTTRLDRDLSDQARPLYEFFTTTRLEPFASDVAAQMLSAIALEHGDRDVADYLASDDGCSRLRVVQHLAGGQPRVWSLFGDALTVPALRELVDYLIGRFDDLTPYYQEQLGRLSAQQRLVVSELALADRPLHVAAIADLVEADQRSVGKTMSELVDRGWVLETSSPVVRMQDRRRTYYELAEPLARIAFQLKETRDGAPLRVVVDFLKGWFTPAALDEVAKGSSTYVDLARGELRTDTTLAVALRLSRLPTYRAPAVELLGEVDDALTALGAGDPDPLIALPTSVRSAIEQRLGSNWHEPDRLHAIRLDVHRDAAQEFGNLPHPGRRAWISRAESLVASAVPAWPAQLQLVTWLAGEWEFDHARAVLAAAELGGARDHSDTLACRSNLAAGYSAAGRTSDAITMDEQTLATMERVLGPDHPNTLTSRSNLAVGYRAAGRTSDAITLDKQTLATMERVLGPDHPHTKGLRQA